MATAVVTVPRSRETLLILGGSVAFALVLGLLGAVRVAPELARSGPSNSFIAVRPVEAASRRLVPNGPPDEAAASPAEPLASTSPELLTGSLPATRPAREETAPGEAISAPPVRRVSTTKVSADSTEPDGTDEPWLDLAVPHDVRALDGASFRIGTATYRLAGVPAIPADQICATGSGRLWPCGSRARAALRLAVMDQALRCRPLANEPEGIVTVSCLKAAGR